MAFILSSSLNQAHSLCNQPHHGCLRLRIQQAHQGGAGGGGGQGQGSGGGGSAGGRPRPRVRVRRRLRLLRHQLEEAANTDDVRQRLQAQQAIERDFTLDRLKPAFRKLKELADGHGLLPKVEPPLEEKINHYAPKVDQLAGIVLKALAKKDDASEEEEEEDED